MNILLFLKLYLRVFGMLEEQTLGPLFMEVFVIPYMLVLYQASSSQSRAPVMQTSSDLSGRTKRKAEENGKFSKRGKRLIIYLFGCAGSSLLFAAFSSCDKWGLLLVVVHRLLILVASLIVEHRL